jgi:hypothetical protein
MKSLMRASAGLSTQDFFILGSSRFIKVNFLPKSSTDKISNLTKAGTVSEVLYFTEDTLVEFSSPAAKRQTKICNIFGIESLSGIASTKSLNNTEFIKTAYIVEMKEIFLALCNSVQHRLTNIRQIRGSHLRH